MNDLSDQITSALHELADQAAPPNIRVDEAWRTGRRRRQAAIITPVVVLAVALTAGLLAGMPGRGSSYSPAAYVLDRAARVAARSAPLAPRPGQYIAVTSVGTWMTEDSPGSCYAWSWLTVERNKIWWPVSESRPGINRSDAVRHEHLPWGGQPPATGLGVTWLPVSPPGCPDGVPQRFTYHFLAALPTQTAQLRAWIYAHPDGGQSADDQAWTDIYDLLHSMLTPPRLTAALFRVAATIPGATVVRHATDAAGRPGIAVARKVQASTEDSELIFSTRTYRLLGGRDRLTVPEQGIGPAGTVIDAWALLNKTVVSHLPPRHEGQAGAAHHC